MQLAWTIKQVHDSKLMWSIAKPTSPRRGAGASALFVRVAGSIVDDIQRGALRSGDRLPSTRALADRFAVNRNTIVAAYDELVAQGWVVTRGPSGTFVADEMPERTARKPTATIESRGMAARAGFDLPAGPPIRVPLGPAGTRYHLSGGVPDTRLFPSALLSRAYRRALRSRTGRAGLDYGDSAGTPRLREAIAAMLRAHRGIPATASNILITRGSQMAIDLIARLLLGPSTTVAVEEIGYAPAWRAFEQTGAQLVPIAIDANGLVVDDLPRPPPRCVYVTPHHQYPTTVLMSPARRLALLARARTDRFAILEDDYDHEFHFDGRPVAPLAASDRHGSVLYVGTLSKILAPGLRLGYLAAPERVVDALARLRHAMDRQGDQILEHAVAELIEDGELVRHARKMRRIYEARRDALVTALRRDLGSVLSFDIPAGGITLWARVADDIDLERWRTRALAQGVAFTSARDLAVDGRPRPFVRIAYARYDEPELADAVRRMRRALRA
jgi:GntR family transcriptional regulator/MocR family aminotransferase